MFYKRSPNPSSAHGDLVLELVIYTKPFIYYKNIIWDKHTWNLQQLRQMLEWWGRGVMVNGLKSDENKITTTAGDKFNFFSHTARFCSEIS